MKKTSITKATDFDRHFDEGGDISSYVVASSIHRPGLEQRRVNVDFPSWIIDSLDQKARRIGVTRQSLIKLWITEKLEHRNG
ncbi:MAG: CopG family transcriptional regulator [Verrucomicrobiia bacterium]